MNTRRVATPVRPSPPPAAFPQRDRARIGALLLVGLLSACRGHDQPAGTIQGAPRPPALVATSAATQEGSRQEIDRRSSIEPARHSKQILFGDLHVHTTYSFDAFVYALPLFGGEGLHPPADACDFARYCAALDFFAITDHAEGLIPEHWERTKESLRDCNARAGDPANPDLVAFVGWEWTQVGATPETHYGHKNIIFPGLSDDELPARPITALRPETFRRTPSRWVLRAPQLLAPFGLRPYMDVLWLIERLAELRNCEPGIDTRELPHDCRENAATPRDLFEKLAQWGFDTLVIPHGLAWGLHVPVDARLDNQLDRTQHDAERQRLIEVFSGHGNSEEYRPWRGVSVDARGEPTCPPPSRDFLPCCWRAGEIMRARCGDLPAAECTVRVEEAKRLAIEADAAPHLVFPETRPEDWLDCDQCRDCFKPAFSLRPRETAQYALALARPDGTRFRWGFIASSDDHRAQPGTGYKQLARRQMADARGLTKFHDRLLRRRLLGAEADPQRAQSGRREGQGFSGLLDVERVSSFMYPGGLVAAHATARHRAAIWDALKRREVYGTSGPRILLWFDLVNGPQGPLPMGSAVTLRAPPRFEVRAVGSFVQEPGCREESRRGLSPERLRALCQDECDNPGDVRHLITAIEVVRVRPQIRAGEDVNGLIQDPWRRFDCPRDPAGCVVTFEDNEYVSSGRDAVYYVRVLQEETPAINGANFRTEFDADGNAVRISPCYGNVPTDPDDDCLAPLHERAWSSPIFVDQTRDRGVGLD